MNSGNDSSRQDNPQTSRVSPLAASGIARSIFSNWFGLAANILIAYFLSPFVVHRLGDTAYGIWALVLQMTGYMGVVDVGLRSALVRFVSRLRAQRDDKALDTLFSTVLILYGSLALVCFAAGFLLAAFVLPHLHIPAAMLESARITMILAAIILGTDFLFSTYQASLAAMSRWDLRNAVAVGVMVVRAALVVGFLLAGYGLVTLAVIQLVCSIAGHIVEIVLVHRLLPALRISFRYAQAAILRPIMTHSTHAFLIGIGGTINYEVDTIVIAALLPVDQVTLYVIGSRLVQYLRLLINGTTSIFAPLASELDAHGQHETISQLLIRGSKYSLLIGYLGTAGLLCLGPAFIRIWMGSSYGPTSGKVLMILAAGQIVSLTEMMAGHLLYGLGKHRINTWCTLGEAAANLGASIALARPLGIYGVALGTTIAASIFRGWIFPAAFLKLFEVRWKDYLKLSIWRALLPALGFSIGALAVEAIVPIHSYPTLLLSWSAGMLLFIAALCMGVFDADERDRIRTFLGGGRLGKLAGFLGERRNPETIAR